MGLQLGWCLGLTGLLECGPILEVVRSIEILGVSAAAYFDFDCMPYV